MMDLQMIDKTVNQEINKVSNILIILLNIKGTLISHFLAMVIP